MGIFIAIAWRNVLRNPKRSLITIFGITVGLTALIFLWSLYEGLIPLMADNMTGLYMGHMQIASTQYIEKPLLENAVVDGGSIIEAVATQPGIEAYSPRLVSYGLVSYGDNSQGAAITGVDPELESRVGRLDDNVQEGGTFLKGDDRRGVVIGADIARNIDAGIGDEVLLVMANRFNSLSYIGPLPIVGIIKCNLPEIDSSTVFVDREMLAQELFIDTGVEYTNPDAEVHDVSGVFTTLALRVKDQRNLESIQVDLRSKVPDTVSVRTWGEIAPWFENMDKFRQAFSYIILFIVLLIVIAGILNTVLMSVMERTREFGIMRALGTKGWQISLTVSLESTFLGLIGIACGSILGAGLVLLFSQIGIDLYGKLGASMMAQFYVFDTVVYPALDLRLLINTCVIILIAVILVSLYPARKAAKMEPVSAIKALG